LKGKIMAKVVLDMSMSLDGFISAPNDEDGGLHNWYFSPSSVSAAVIAELIDSTGAIMMGRRSYDMGDKYDGYVDNPYKVPHIVLTHQKPAKIAKGETTFIFVTDGVESAIEQAKTAAGDRDVVIGGGANTARQCLERGLVDELQLHLIPLLLNSGIRLFDEISGEQVKLERVSLIEAPNVTHLRFRVIR
jgi:dihydrofolate reductase